MTDDRFDLERFVRAQDRGGSYDVAISELRRGHKREHWMWWVFPQVIGLGRSGNATDYAIGDLDEARAYLAHPALGPRLREAAQALLDQPDRDAERVMGHIDAIKLRSSMTLFEAAAPDEPLFGQVLDEFFAGERDPKTLEILQR